MRRLEKEVVVEAGIEDEADLVPMRLQHGHEVADAQVLDPAVVEENPHQGNNRTPFVPMSSSSAARGRIFRADPAGSSSRLTPATSTAPARAWRLPGRRSGRSSPRDTRTRLRSRVKR